MSTPSTKDSSYIATQANRVLALLKTDEQKLAFAKALKRSIELDINGNVPPKASSITEIDELYGFSPRLQKDYSIALNKQEAKKFLTDFGYPVNKSFDKIHNRDEYEGFFKREVTIVNKKQILLTYSEWLHIVRFEFQPDLPKSIIHILK